MGSDGCKQTDTSSKTNEQGSPIPDKYRTYAELERALRNAGVESLQCAFFFDFSKSNCWTGEQAYGGRSLHDTTFVNPYIHAIYIMAPLIPKFDDDGVLPAFRFGCSESKDRKALPLEHPFKSDPHYSSPYELITAYVYMVPKIVMSGPTTFAPVIDKAIEISEAYEHKYHLFVIIMTDGDVSDVEKDTRALIRASSYPISFCALGFGDGKFEKMHFFDDMKGRKFDNFYFVNFTEIELNSAHLENPELALCTAMMQEIPDQYKCMRKFGLLK